jgi:cytochrome c oxidase subunit 2
MVDYLGLPAQAATHAADVDHMMGLVHWLMLILFVGWGTFFVFVLVRFRKGANPKANYAGAKGKFAKGTELAVVVAEMILLFWYAIPGWYTRVNAFPSESEAVVVHVVARQFEWQVIYPGADGQFGRREITRVASDNPVGIDRSDQAAKDDIISTNTLVLPVDRPVLVHLTTQDVIHSFGLPQMRVKQDAVPGLSMPVWFIPNKIGDYEIACSQLCGLGHSRMRGFLNIKSQADYEMFLAEEAKALAQ